MADEENMLKNTNLYGGVVFVRYYTSDVYGMDTL